MKAAQAKARKVVASFLEEIPTNKGWWYRVPKVNPTAVPKDSTSPDTILPHFGTVFGLTEHATAIILVELGCLGSIRGGESTRFLKKGWEDLAATFKVADLIETEQTMICGRTNWYVRLGRLPGDLASPSRIYKAWTKNKNMLFPPSGLGSRRTRKFVTMELVQMLKGSILFDQVLGNHHVIPPQQACDIEEQKSSDEDENGIMQEEREVQTADHWSLTQGEMADASEYPILASFGIPINNPQATRGLVSEIARLQKSQNILPPGISVGDAVCGNSKVYVQLPSTLSISSRRRFASSVSGMILQAPEESRRALMTTLLQRCDRQDPDTFLDVAIEQGYCTQKTPRMSAHYWVAMVEDANLRTGQERIINAYLTEHFGKRMCVSEKEVGKVGSKYVPYTTTRRTFDDRKILFSHRSATDLFRQYATTIFGDDRGEASIDKLEILLGGDHGKGAFTFMFVLVIRYVDETKDPTILEFQIGQIDSTEDSMELLRPLLVDMELGVQEMEPVDGKSMVYVDEDFKLSFGHDNQTDAIGIGMEFYLIGDLKFLFMVLGRSGYSGSNCLYCDLTITQWKKLHLEKGLDCGGHEVTIEGLSARYVTSTQNQDETMPLSSIGQKELPVWNFIPIMNTLIPLLHILLWLGNDLLEHFWKWLDERVEPLTTEEVEARNMSLLAEIGVEDQAAEVKLAKEILQQKIDERIQINQELRQPFESQETKMQVLAYKETIQEEEADARKDRDEKEKLLKGRKVALAEAKKVETDVRSKRGRKDKSVRQGVLDVLQSKYKVEMSKYHGGDMEGPSVRKLMASGVDAFGSIAEYLKMERTDSNTDSFHAKDDEIDTTCNDHGTLYVMLDGVFSLLNTKRGLVSDPIIEDLRERLEGLRAEWYRLLLSVTPKFHILLNHAIQQLCQTLGLSDMGEDIIERAHQIRVRHESRLIRLRNISKKMETQAKHQGISHIKEVRDIQSTVGKGRKRKLSNTTPLAIVKSIEKKVKRDNDRREVWEIKKEEENSQAVIAPRDIVKLEYRASRNTNN
jgi:hypothetical protein